MVTTNTNIETESGCCCQAKLNPLRVKVRRIRWKNIT